MAPSGPKTPPCHFQRPSPTRPRPTCRTSPRHVADKAMDSSTSKWKQRCTITIARYHSCILFFPSCIFWRYLIPVVFGWAGAKNSKMNNGYRWLQGSQLGILLAAAAFTTRQLWLQGPMKRSVANTTHEWSSWWEIYQWMNGMEWSGVKW